MTAKNTAPARKLLTRAELAALRADRDGCARRLAEDPDLLDLLLRQAEYAVECAALLDELEHVPAEPYGEAAALIARITDACNDLWNRYHYAG